ncbi:protein of unknown function [Serratia sp. Tan611]|nr:protein of unknown function [Serratia sp. Tan611]
MLSILCNNNVTADVTVWALKENYVTENRKVAVSITRQAVWHGIQPPSDDLYLFYAGGAGRHRREALSAHRPAGRAALPGRAAPL